MKNQFDTLERGPAFRPNQAVRVRNQADEMHRVTLLDLDTRFDF
jgi:hypothetical protein